MDMIPVDLICNINSVIIRNDKIDMLYKIVVDEIIELGILVVVYKDRLTRFSFDLIEWMIKEYSDGKIIVLNRNEEQTPHEEISKDILSIMNVYVAKRNGLRKYKSLIKNELK